MIGRRKMITRLKRTICFSETTRSPFLKAIRKLKIYLRSLAHSRAAIVSNRLTIGMLRGDYKMIPIAFQVSRSQLRDSCFREIF